MSPIVLFVLFGAIIAASLLAAPRRASVEGFFGGMTAQGGAPGLWTLVLSQVTTWIFARSLMNAAILGFYYGIAGTLAYAAYYGSFLTGGYIVGRMRAQGATSVQSWLAERFGATGTTAYNLVIALRLLSEVFANLLVVGLIFAAALPDVAGAETTAILVVGVLALAYSAWGGLSAALRTDVVQMVVFLVVFGVAFVALVVSPGFDLGAVVTAPGTAGAYNGWVLLAVALLQVFSYPAHDPVMMDRGVIADRRTTRLSFLHAGWLSVLCVLAFGMLGVIAGLHKETGEAMLSALNRLLGEPTMILFNIALIVSAISTLDSTLSSAAKLAIADMRIASERVSNGRIAMIAFTLGGLGFLFLGSKDLFGAVAVSGSASVIHQAAISTTSKSIQISFNRFTIFCYTANCLCS